MPHLLSMSYGIMWTLISVPLQMAERLRRAQPDSVVNHVKARHSLIERSVTWLATESGWARRKRYAICRGKLCRGFIIFEQCCPCGLQYVAVVIVVVLVLILVRVPVPVRPPPPTHPHLFPVLIFSFPCSSSFSSSSSSGSSWKFFHRCILRQESPI